MDVESGGACGAASASGLGGAPGFGAVSGFLAGVFSPQEAQLQNAPWRGLSVPRDQQAKEENS